MATDVANEEVVEEEIVEAEVEEAEEIEGPEQAEEEAEEDEDAEPEENLEDIAAARELLKQLQGPNRKIAIQNLAAANGISFTKEPEKAPDAPRSTQQIVADALGPDYEFLSDKLGVALEDIVRTQIAPQFTKIQETNHQTELTRELESAQVRHGFKPGDALYNKMDQISTRFPKGPTVSIKEYLDTLHTLATAGQEKLNKRVRKVQKISAAAKGDGLKSSSVSDGRITKHPDGKLSIGDAIRQTLDNASEEELYIDGE